LMPRRSRALISQVSRLRLFRVSITETEPPMFASTTLCCALLIAAPPTVETKFDQVAPVPTETGKVIRSKEQGRAVVLLHGYRPYPNEDAVAHADYRDWQKPGSLLVNALAKDTDVFSFAYAQNVGLDVVVASGGLATAVKQLRTAGYREIVLMGHSAGALVARQFVEDNPESGVTKLIQVCPPNGGSEAAGIESFKAQRAFLDCLTPEGRQKCLKERAAKKVPESVQFVCILSNAAVDSDGLVRCDCQWTADLQMQCVPVMPIKVVHNMVPRLPKGVEAMAEAVRLDQPRWKPERVREVKKELFK
jgi:pimeloyl-ACP methyl ester carboxylesterase